MQATFDFAANHGPEQVVFRFEDSDGVDRWVYDVARMKLWYQGWFAGMRADSEYDLRRHAENGWERRLVGWQESTPEPRSDLVWPGPGAWHVADVLPEGSEEVRDIHRKLCAWHSVDERHRAKLDEAFGQARSRGA